MLKPRKSRYFFLHSLSLVCFLFGAIAASAQPKGSKQKVPPRAGSKTSTSTKQPAPKTSNSSLQWTWKIKGKALQIHLATPPKGSPSLVGLLQLPAQPAQVVQWSHYLYLACRQAGLLVVSVSDPSKPQIVGQKVRGADVIGLRLEGTLLVLEVAQYKFKVLSLNQPSNPTALRSQGSKAQGFLVGRALPKTGPVVVVQPKAKRRPPLGTSKTSKKSKVSQPKRNPNKRSWQEGRVVRVRKGFVVINKGLKDGIRRGDRVAILAHRVVTKYDPNTDRSIRTPSRRLKAVIVIDKVYKTRSSGRLGRGDLAHPNDFAQPTKKPLSHRLFFPQRTGGFWRLQTSLSPILGLNQGSFGLISFTTLSYSFEAPFQIALSMNPFTTVIGAPNSAASANLLLRLSYDTSYIALMLGLGYQAVTGGKSGLVFMQGIRLGATDGLNLRFISQLVLLPSFPGSNRLVFEIGTLHGDINIPLTRKVTLFLEGGGGSVDWFHAQIGIRTYLWGRGGGDTLILSGGVGAAGVLPASTDIQRAQAVGPMVSASIDWRF